MRAHSISPKPSTWRLILFGWLTFFLTGAAVGQNFAELESRVEAAALGGDPDELAQALATLAKSYEETGEQSLALGVYEELGMNAAARGHAPGQIRALSASGRLHRSLGNYADAIEQLATGLRLAREVGEEESIGELLHDIGKVYADSGDAELSSKFLTQAMERMDVMETPGRHRVLTNLGVAQTRLGRLEQAIVTYRRALELAELAMDGPDGVSARSSAGVACIALGENERAVEYLLQACESLRTRGDSSTYAAALILLGFAYELDGRPAAAKAVLDQAHVLSTATQSRGLEVNALHTLSGVHSSLGEPLQANLLALDSYRKDRVRMLAEHHGALAEFRASYAARESQLAIVTLENEARVTAASFTRTSHQRRWLMGTIAVVVFIMTGLVLLLRSRRWAHRQLLIASAESGRERDRLQVALDQASTLRGLLEICEGCSSIQDEQGTWVRLETYVERQTGALFTHGICPTCLNHYYPTFAATN